MKNEYDFANVEQGKFYRPIEELEIPTFKNEDEERKFTRSNAPALECILRIYN